MFKTMAVKSSLCEYMNPEIAENDQCYKTKCCRIAILVIIFKVPHEGRAIL